MVIPILGPFDVEVDRALGGRDVIHLLQHQITPREGGPHEQVVVETPPGPQAEEGSPEPGRSIEVEAIDDQVPDDGDRVGYGGG